MPSFWTGQTKAAQEKRRIVSEHQVIQHMTFELERKYMYLRAGGVPTRRKYMHMSQFERDTGSKEFDSEMIRAESRNVERVCPLDKKTYRNCLEIKQLTAPVMNRKKVVVPHI